MEGEDESGVNSKRVEALKGETRFDGFANCKVEFSGNTGL